jgi:hypothetical protein
LKLLYFITNRQITDEAPNLKTEALIICCWVRLRHISGVNDESVWNKGGMMISKENSKKLKESPVPLSLQPS